jgi:hypothetical protein
MMSLVRRLAVAPGLVVLLATAACAGDPAPPSTTGATTPPVVVTSATAAPATSAAPETSAASVPPFTGKLTSLLLPVPAGWQKLSNLGGPDGTLTLAELDQLYGAGFAQAAGIKAGVLRQWKKGKVVVTIGLFQVVDEQHTVLLIDPRQYAGDATKVEEGPVQQGVGGHYYVFKANTATTAGEPYAVVKTSRGTIVVDMSVSGGTVASVKADALALFKTQFAKIP